MEEQPEDSKFYLAFPLHLHEGHSIKEEIDLLKKHGFFRIYFKKKMVDLNEEEKLPAKKDKVSIVIDRFKVQKGKVRDRLSDAIEVTFKEGENRLVLVNAETFVEKEFNKFYECCGIRYEEPEPRFFSFNNPFGACPVCQGFSRVIGVDMNLVIPNPSLSITDGALAPFRSAKYSTHLRDLIRNAKQFGIPLNVPYNNLTADQVALIKKGFGDYIGVDRFFEKLESKIYKMHIRVMLSRYRGYTLCSACKGSRLRRESLQVKINGKSIYDVVKIPIELSLRYLKNCYLRNLK